MATPSPPDRNQKSSGVSIGTVIGGIRNSIIAGRDVIVQNFSDDTSRRDQRNRQAMLGLVKSLWIKGVLDESLRGATFIGLRLEERQEAVEPFWQGLVHPPARSDRIFPAGTKLVEVFDDSGQELLILGKAGSGKTTMLLDLVRETIARAERDASQPIPVVFNLSSWAANRQPLAQWLVAELTIRYNIPQKIASLWLERDELLLLLDGLDEVTPSYREACVQAINAFRQQHLVPLVVCSRSAVYKALSTRLRLRRAVLLQPPAPKQIDTYLQQAGPPLAAVSSIWRQDPALQALVQSPLMLSMMVSAFQDDDDQPPILSFTPDTYQQLFEVYLKRMFARRGKAAPYKPEQMVRWLSGLAQKMKDHDQTQLLIEALQYSWLSTKKRQQQYHLGVRAAGSLAFVTLSSLSYILAVGLHALLGGPAVELADLPRALAVGSVAGLAFFLSSLTFVRWWGVPLAAIVIGSLLIPTGIFPPIVALGVGVIFGLPAGLAGLSSTTWQTIDLAESLTWSWVKATLGLGIGLVPGVAIGLLANTWVNGLELGLPLGLIVALILGLRRTEAVDTRTRPGQGLWRSGRNGLQVGLRAMLITILLGTVGGILQGGVLFGAAFGVLVAGTVGLAAGLFAGGAACLQHITLRFILYRAGVIPWNLVQFLDYGVEQIFLRRVGSGYTFIHRLLFDYFLALKGRLPG